MRISLFILSATISLLSGATEHEVRITNAAAGVTLAGTLSTPVHTTPRAVVIMATGSGPQDRDETIAGHKPFKVIADTLSAHGYAVLRMDDRGTGQSTGSFAGAVNEDFVSDMAAVLAYADSCFKDIPAGVLGHSEGGTTAIKTAVRNPLCRFIITLAAPAWKGDSLIMAQSRTLAVAMTGSWKGEKLQRQLMEIASSAIHDIQARTMMNYALTESLGEMASLPSARKQIDAQIDGVLSPWFRDMLRYDPSRDIASVSVPWLAMGGSLDTQVPPANLITISALCPGATIHELKGHNHLFQHAVTGLPTEYATLPEAISPETLAIITGWLDSRF